MATLKKKVSAAGFRLTGGGWYETDFKSGKKKNLAGDSSDAKSSASSSSASTSGDKPSTVSKPEAAPAKKASSE
jgi:predicted nucleic acid-binding Zn ribbon protein